MVKSKQSKHVALALPLTVPHLSLTLRGITDYARAHANWIIRVHFPEVIGAGPDEFTVRHLDGWDGDGVLALIATEADARAARRLPVPVVNITGVIEDAGVARVMVDQQAIGRMAAEHLLERGLRRLGFCGFRDVWYSTLRRRAFVEAADRAGAQTAVFEQPVGHRDRSSRQRSLAGLRRWLRELQPPVGVLAVHDFHARLVVDQCEALALRIPDDVALVGIDDNQMVCEFCRVPLSSIPRSDYQIGYQAAALLDRLMDGQPIPKQDILIPPGELVMRRSSDILAFDDPHVSAAVRFIWEHASEPFGVEAIVRQVPISRRLLEKRFKAQVGTTPHEYLNRTRVERAKQLLVGPERHTIAEVARRCGFSSSQRLRIVFRRLVGTSPIDYRRTEGSRQPAARGRA